MVKISNKRTFCDANHELRSLVQDAISEIEMSIKYDDVSSLETILNDLIVMENIIEETQEYVESMEKRMQKYRTSIESLGFIRSKEEE